MAAVSGAQLDGARRGTVTCRQSVISQCFIAIFRISIPSKIPSWHWRWSSMRTQIAADGLFRINPRHQNLFCDPPTISCLRTAKNRIKPHPTKQPWQVQSAPPVVARPHLCQPTDQRLQSAGVHRLPSCRNLHPAPHCQGWRDEDRAASPHRPQGSAMSPSGESNMRAGRGSKQSTSIGLLRGWMS